MKIHFIERDSRKNDADFRHTAGSFSVIQHILEKGLRELDSYTENLEEADFVGIADSLATDFKIGGKKCFGIYFVDCINTIPNITLERLKNNPNLKLFSINQHTASLFEKYGHKCTVLGAGVDSDFWVPDDVKSEKFTFIHTGFSNIRSGLDQLLPSYDLAFRGNKNVRLIIKDTSNSPILAQRISEYQKNNDILYINKRMTCNQMRVMYQSSHVLCSVFRHSGHGLPIGEAAFCNCLPLVGNFAPSNEIVDSSFGVLLIPNSMVNINDIKPSLVSEWGLTDTFGGLKFPEEPMVYEYNIAEYAYALEYCYNNYYNFKNIRQNAMKKWDYLKSARNLVNSLENEK